MCGRFVSTSTPEELADWFDADAPADLRFEPSWNVAPTDDVPVVVADADGGRHLRYHHWGLVPPWADDPTIGSRMINARAESLADKPAFRGAFAARRCLVVADGFYEWRGAGTKAREPFYVHDPDGSVYAFAGLWERWRDPRQDGEVLHSTTIVTTTPNGPMSAIHHRMPVILDRADWDRWLDPANDEPGQLERLLVPAPDGRTVMHRVGSAVGNVRNQGPHLIATVEPDTLFEL